MADSSETSAPRKKRKNGPGRPYEKGTSGNPGGKSAEREELRRYQRETYGRDAIDGIAAMAGLVPGKRAAKSEKVKLDAKKWHADQAIGKAAQAFTGPDGKPITVDASAALVQALARLASSGE